MVFQDFRLLKDRNVYDNVAFAQKVVGEPNSRIKKKVPLMLSMVGLAAKYRSFPKQLSGGEQQRVAIARAVVHCPKVVFADEPTGALDTAAGFEVMRLFRELIDDEDITIVMTTHDPNLMELGDEVFELSDGIVI